MKIGTPRPVNLPQLQKELAAAGLILNGLLTLGDPPSEVFSYTSHGDIVDISGSFQAVVDAHTGTPLADPLPPRIAELISALAASPSIDQPTKDKLTAALKGI